MNLLDGDAFGEVARLVHVAAEGGRDVVGEELQGDGCEDRGEIIRGGGDEDHVVADFGECGVAFGADRNDRASAGFDLLDVAHVLVEDRVLRRDENRRGLLVDQGDDPVLELGTRIPRRRNVADLLELQRPLERDRVIRLTAEKKKIFGSIILEQKILIN